MTWADEEMARLMKKGRDNWDENDHEVFCYIQNVNAEADYYAQLD